MVSSVTLPYLTLCGPMDCSTSGLPVDCQLLELAQRESVSIKSVMPSNHLILCHPLLLLPPIFPSIRVFPRSGVSSSYHVAKVLEFQLQHHSFQWIFRTDFL